MSRNKIFLLILVLSLSTFKPDAYAENNRAPLTTSGEFPDAFALKKQNINNQGKIIRLEKEWISSYKHLQRNLRSIRRKERSIGNACYLLPSSIWENHHETWVYLSRQFTHLKRKANTFWEAWEQLDPSDYKGLKKLHDQVLTTEKKVKKLKKQFTSFHRQIRKEMFASVPLTQIISARLQSFFFNHCVDRASRMD